MSTRILVVYFSCTGATKLIAEYVTEVLGADIYEIIPENPYTETDLAYYTNGRADKEQNDSDVRLTISGSVENMDENQKPALKKSEMPIHDAVILWLLRNVR